MTSPEDTLTQILQAIKTLHDDHQTLAKTVDSSNDKIGRVLVDFEDRISTLQKAVKGTSRTPLSADGISEETLAKLAKEKQSQGDSTSPSASAAISPTVSSVSLASMAAGGKLTERRYSNNDPSKWPNRITITTYPGQVGVEPIPFQWGLADPHQRGPVVVSRAPSTIKRRNALGAHFGSYSVYQALAVAMNDLPVNHTPNFTNAQPPVSFGPFPQWSDPKKIVSIDPFGHLAPWIFEDYIKAGIDIRPTMAITKAHMQLAEIREMVEKGDLKIDGKVVLNEIGDLAVTKVAVEPVWYLPGVAERLGVDEGTLRRNLFEVMGGSYPELITRNDIKVFLPPIGGQTVYIFGDPAKVSQKDVKLALRVHDECNGSDVFGSDICTCRPYLLFGIAEAVREAQNGGSGVVIYFRKEGRALGEVTKYLVYNARKRGGDTAAEYFKRTENIAGVKDMRFQLLMPDILHFLGITKIDRMLSMSNMKHDAIVDQGIPILERVPIPEEMIPDDSRVEIDAKIHAGYFTTGKVLTADELKNVKGRNWEDIDH